MSNVLKFQRPTPKEPERKPTANKPRMRTLPVWAPWAGFAVVVALYYLFQYTSLFGG